MKYFNYKKAGVKLAIEVCDYNPWTKEWLEEEGKDIKVEVQKGVKKMEADLVNHNILPEVGDRLRLPIECKKIDFDNYKITELEFGEGTIHILL